MRFKIGSLMFVTGICALAMGAARVHPPLGPATILAALAYPILTTPGQGWRRRGRPDFRRAAFCYVAGVLAPFLCLIFDPIVFVERWGGGARGHYLPFCFVLMGTEMALMTAWLWARDPLRRAAGPISGAMWAGAAFALGIGLWLLPLSVIGTFFMGIGLLGFTPFLTAWAFAIQARAARDDARNSAAPRGLLAIQIGGALFVAGIALAGSHVIPG